MEDYQDMPVTSFGAAMLRGMGWKKGEAIGGTSKGYDNIPIVVVFFGDVVGSLDNSLVILHEIIPSVASKRVHMTKKHVLSG